jgi:TetR/AcrR family transcriptional repressor of nem operon
MSHKANDKVSTPERIIEAATTLMWRDGYHSVSVDKICCNAGVQKGSFYHAFSSKADLLLIIIKRMWELDRRDIEEIYATDRSTEAKIRNHLKWVCLTQKQLKAKLGFVPGTFDMVIDINIPEEVSDFIREARQQHLEFFENAIVVLLCPQGFQRETAIWFAAVIVNYFTGVLIDARLRNSLTSLELLPETALSLIALAAPPGAKFREGSTLPGQVLMPENANIPEKPTT